MFGPREGVDGHGTTAMGGSGVPADRSIHNATVGATIAEFIGSDPSLGFYIPIVTGKMRPDLAFAGNFLLTLLGLVLRGIVTVAERQAIPWHISVRRTK
jgi:NitT/TauT family transport system permease protein